MVGLATVAPLEQNIRPRGLARRDTLVPMRQIAELHLQVAGDPWVDGVVDVLAARLSATKPGGGTRFRADASPLVLVPEFAAPNTPSRGRLAEHGRSGFVGAVGTAHAGATRGVTAAAMAGTSLTDDPKAEAATASCGGRDCTRFATGNRGNAWQAP
eukprot:CAMPEP_0115761152 /NCGR_PEP_ID=MMETSP0272-20121206/100360_1 /TAXON_ID=71861 /ORGANISM="Scrippsiella trochoidea, Strain CCMP3099" /LENGTH=156 /DNA_ID=CAMNT_0003206825 /DNA_START=152 /DNA_END=623 /DNA_ORIENTATION=-